MQTSSPPEALERVVASMLDELSGCSGIGTAHKAELMKLTWLDRPSLRRERLAKRPQEACGDATCRSSILVNVALPRCKQHVVVFYFTTTSDGLKARSALDGYYVALHVQLRESIRQINEWSRS